jgi:hypothetical protein
MRVIRKRQRLALFLIIGATLALTAAAAAYALTASSFTYSSPKTGYVRVSNLAFAPDGGGGEYSNQMYTGLRSTSPVGSFCFVAGVDLPAGSRVQAITFTFRSGPGSDFEGRFYRRHLPLPTGIKLLAASAPGSDSGKTTTDRIPIGAAKRPVTAAHAYGIDVCLGTDDAFFGARIEYTYTSAGS